MQKTILKAIAQVIDAPSMLDDDICKSIAKVAGIEDVNQEDLLHVRSTLVTSGANDNQDVFLRDELWKARLTPLHKPSNWDHKRKKIIGHIYKVEARTLDGEELDISASTPTFRNGTAHDGDFELIVDEVVYDFLLPEFADEIRKRSESGQLSVSMEVWFTDYDFAVWSKPELAANQSEGVALLSDANFEVLSRKDNPDLELFLRTSKGNGKTQDGKLIGRALRNMIFGGKGFVAVPANPRSKIHMVGDVKTEAKVENSEYKGTEKFVSAAENGDGWTHTFIVRTSVWNEEIFGVEVRGEVKGDSSLEQATTAFTDNVLPRISQIGQNGLEALKFSGKLENIARRKTVEQFEDENRLEYICFLDMVPELVEEEEPEEAGSSVLATVASSEVKMDKDALKQIEDLQKELADLRTENQKLKSESEVETARAESASRLERVDKMVQAVATPEEIARIDRAIQNGEDPFQAKLAFLEQTRVRANAQLETAEEKIAEYRVSERMTKVKELDLYSDKLLAKVEKKVANLSDEEFEDWLEEKKLFSDEKKALADRIAELEKDDEAEEEPEKVLASATPENEPNFTETETPKSDTTEAEATEDVFKQLAKRLTRTKTPRMERREKKLAGLKKEV